MTVVGFHNSHEQVHPRELLRAVRHAEEVGFNAAMCSDHFSPWSERQGHSGFAWSWLGAALATTDLTFGVVNAPGQRYHPAIVAQAIATLNAMFDGRLWVALGSGEFSNEHITGETWPRKELRDRRLRECVEVIRALLRGEEVSHDGLVRVDRARIWTLPDQQPQLIGAAVTPRTAAAHADWADGLATVNQPPEALRRVVDAYRGAGGRGDVSLQVHVCWDPDQERAEQIAHDQWRSNVLGPPAAWDIDSAAVFDQLSAHVSVEAVKDVVVVEADLGRLTERLRDVVAIGFDRVYVHHVGQEQLPFLDAFGEHVLPWLTAS